MLWGNRCAGSAELPWCYLQLHLLKLVYLLRSLLSAAKVPLTQRQGRDLDSLKWDSVKLLLRDLSGLQDLSYRNMVCSSAVYFCLALLAMPLTKLSSHRLPQNGSGYYLFALPPDFPFSLPYLWKRASCCATSQVAATKTLVCCVSFVGIRE